MGIDLIYSLRGLAPYDVNHDNSFFLVTSLSDALRYLRILINDRGLIGAAKLVAKITLGRCHYFGLADGNSPISTGIAALGYCSFYEVPTDAVVIGEIVTNEQCRGRGFATKAIMLLINAQMNRGRALFFIDTQGGNAPMIRAIQKLGFHPQYGNHGKPLVS
ncbi:MAG TPA: GNAT family N-acetyltransferase [Steroidobacteraceae bacterium]|jgi:ribosomal protein S18 acetylase RimI-like enzyme|nr:GNAT family N-acetyltransferase [Steroidobacteraceae bacterium]